MVRQRKYLFAADLVVPNCWSTWTAPAVSSVARTLVLVGSSARAMETVVDVSVGFGFGCLAVSVGVGRAFPWTELVSDIVMAVDRLDSEISAGLLQVGRCSLSLGHCSTEAVLKCWHRM